MKIVYCTNSIRYLGGIQRVTIVKANALAEIDGNEVYIVVTDNKNGLLVEELSSKVKLIDLDINYYKNDYKRSFIENIFVSIYQRYKHRRKLRKFLKETNPDVVISIGMAEKFMIPAMRNRTWKIIREFHYAKNYRIDFANTIFRRFLGHLGNFIEFKIGKYLLKWDRIVVLSNEDKSLNWKGWKNVAVIPNPTSFCSFNSSTLNERVVMSMGRLSTSKNFQSLISAFKIVVEKHPDWILRIYGEGSEKLSLINQIENLGLQNNVFMMGYSNDVASCLLESSIFALSSLHEGFSLAIVEAMECGVPVVSYQCPCGPKDIVNDGVDGFLVPLHDERMLADRICRLIEDDDLRKKMGAAAKERAKDYHVESVVKQWMELFEDLIKS